MWYAYTRHSLGQYIARHDSASKYMAASLAERCLLCGLKVSPTGHMSWCRHSELIHDSCLNDLIQDPLATLNAVKYLKPELGLALLLALLQQEGHNLASLLRQGTSLFSRSLFCSLRHGTSQCVSRQKFQQPSKLINSITELLLGNGLCCAAQV